MRVFSTENLKLAAVGGVCLTVGLIGPAAATAAFDAVNADKVDGRHAVGPAATVSDRAGRLVATNPQGRLPNNIIAKAPDADTLDGVDASGFAPFEHEHDGRYHTRPEAEELFLSPHEGDGRYVLRSDPRSVPSDERFTVMYPLASGVGFMSIRADASIRERSDINATVTRIGVGQYCLSAPGAREGAVGSLQNLGFRTGGTIRVSMGVGSVCNDVVGANITVETFGI